MPGASQKRRRRKRRGTQSGRVDTRGPRGRPRNRAEAKARARSRAKGSPKQPRHMREPTWRSAVNRGLVAAGIFLFLLVLLFGRPIGEAVGLSAFMLLIYIPMGYYMDRFFFRLRMRREARAQEKRVAEKAKPS